MMRLCAGITDDLGAMEVFYYSIILLFYYYGVRNQIFYSNIWYAEPDGVQQRMVCGNRLCVEPDSVRELDLVRNQYMYCISGKISNIILNIKLLCQENRTIK